MKFYYLKIFTVFIVSIYSTSSAQYLPGAKQIALAHSDVALNSDVFASFNNPAGLVNINSLEVGIYYSPSPFGLKQLANGFGALSKNFEFGALAAGFSIYGFELYKENKISLSLAKEILKNFSAGVSLFFNSLSIKNYSNDNCISFNLGITTQLSESLFLGFAAENITRSTYGNEENQITPKFRTGLSYKIEKVFIIHFAFEKEIENPLSLRFGLEYVPIEFIELRLGFMDEPSLFSGGAGINYSGISVDYALFKHQDLGLTHQVGLIITL